MFEKIFVERGITIVLAVSLIPVLPVRALSQTAGTAYPMLDASFAYAAARHSGEARVGSVGTLNKSAASRSRLQPACARPGLETRCRLQFDFEFRDSDPDEWAGFFLTFGRPAIDTVLPDGTPGPTIENDLYRDGVFDLGNLLKNSQDRISIESVRLILWADGEHRAALTLRVEFEDQNRQKMFRRVRFDPAASAGAAVLTIPLASFAGVIDNTAVKVLSVVVEERHVGDNVTNPQSGGFLIESVALMDEDGPRFEAEAVRSLEDKVMIGVIARRDFETLLRLVDAKTGASLDRTLFRDLIHWGATGWLLAALPAASRLGWISTNDARQRGLLTLRFADNDALWCDNPAGCLGNSRGMLYRFGGIDPTGLNGPRTGTRKIDQGDVNAVEASLIDTALFEFGAATFAAGFRGDQEIEDRVRRILNRPRWDELLDPKSGQFFLAWKPSRDDRPGSLFTTPASFGGFWASRDLSGLQPLTIDYWTDEGALAAVLAAGSEAHPTTAEPWYRMIRQFGQGACDGAIVTFPGAWFTHAFFVATYLDPGLGPDRGAEWETVTIDWHANSVRVFQALQSLSQAGAIVLPDAVELPDTTYLAQGLPVCAADKPAMFSGTRTPYSLQLAMGLGGQESTSAIAELRRLLTEHPETWDPMFGFLDSFNPDLQYFPASSSLLRAQGEWVQQQVWPLNKGAALLAELNYLDNGAVWRTASQSSVIQRGIDKIYRQQALPPRPRIHASGVQVATGAPVVNRMAPRSIFTVFGTQFAPPGSMDSSIQIGANGRIADKLANTCVEINGIRSPMLFGGENQINAQASDKLTPGQGSAVVIRDCGSAAEQRSDGEPVLIAGHSPAFFNFLHRPDGVNPIAGFNATSGTLVGDPSLEKLFPGLRFAPAAPGDSLTLYGTGFGPTSPPLEAGNIPGIAAPLADNATITLGGVTAPAPYVGASPCCAGLDQVNTLIPSNAPDGDLPAVLTINGVSSPLGPFVTVRRTASVCSYAVSPGSSSFDNGPRTGTIVVTTTAGCAWLASSSPNSPWLTITAGGSGVGSGNVNYMIAGNSSSTPRIGSIDIDGNMVTVAQTGSDRGSEDPQARSPVSR